MQRNAHNPLILDGSMGHELIDDKRKNKKCDDPLWSTRILWTKPDEVKKTRQLYLDAGVDYLSSLTFRCTRYAFEKAGFDKDVQEIANLAIQQARQAVEQFGGERNVRITASMAPIEDCYEPDQGPDTETLEREHKANAECFAKAGADLLLVETQNSHREAVIATRAARTTGLPVWTSLMPLSATKLSNGDSLLDTAHEIIELGVDALLVNCCSLRIAAQSFAILRQEFSTMRLGLYPNNLTDQVTEETFADWAVQFVGKADIIGGCCGIGPAHIKSLTDRLSSLS